MSNVLKPASARSTASVDRSTLSTLSTLTRIRSPWSDHACIHKRSSALKFLNWHLSWLPSQLSGIRSLILCGMAVSAGPAESLCMALEILLIAPCLPLIVCISSRSRCKESAFSCLICCCNVIKSAVVAIPACCYVMRRLLLLRQISRASNRLHSRWRLSALRHHVKWNSVLWRILSQRECVGRVLKCTQQLCDKGEECATVSSLRTIQHTCICTYRQTDRQTDSDG